MASRSVTAKQRYEVEVEESGPIELDVTLQDQLRWEMNHNGEAWLVGGAPSFHKLLETAFYAGRRLRVIEERHFDRWKKTVIDLRMVEDDEDEDAERDGDDEQDDQDEPGEGEPATFQ